MATKRASRRSRPTRATPPSARAPDGLTLEQVLGQLPAGLRDELVQALAGIVTNYRHGRWGPSELDGGKLCEVVYSILRGFVDGKYPSRASKPRDFVSACRELERADASTVPRSVRIQIPRLLVAAYEIRNNRGVGHVGGDVDPNHMDATIVVAIARWVTAELVRLFHDADTAVAADVVESLTIRDIPIIWHVGDRRRVLRPDLSWREQMLLVLYASVTPVSENDLIADLEHPQARYFRRDVLRPAHVARLVEWDRTNGEVQISPLGVRYVEEKLPLVT